MTARVERGGLVTGEKVDQCVVPSGCSSCALVLLIGSPPPGVKMSALVSRTQRNAYMSEMQIRNEFTGLA